MTIDLQHFTDNASLNRFHWSLLFWCWLILTIDGYDIAIAGIALPSIMRDMAIEPMRAGFMVSAGLVGMIFGNLLFGALAEKIGQRRAVVTCLASFSLFTAAAAFTHDPWLFSACRFVAGLGLGGVVPNVVAQMTEYTPRRVRSTMVALMFTGYSAGSVVAALVGKALVETHGWPSVFIIGGLPILLVPFVLKHWLDSMLYMLNTGHVDALQRVLRKIDPAYRPAPSDVFVFGTDALEEHAGLLPLFQHGRALSTVMFWIACFVCTFLNYGLGSWLVKLMSDAGYSLGSSMSFALVLNIGALVGGIGGGWLADRFDIKHVLIGMYLTATVSIALLGYPSLGAMLLVVVGVVGATTIGTTIVTIAYAAQFYPVTIRETAVGFLLGVGRLGAITAPVFIGTLVGMSLRHDFLFLAIALPACVAAVAVFLIRRPVNIAPLSGVGPSERTEWLSAIDPAAGLSEDEGPWQSTEPTASSLSSRFPRSI